MPAKSIIPCPPDEAKPERLVLLNGRKVYWPFEPPSVWRRYRAYRAEVIPRLILWTVGGHCRRLEVTL